MNGFDSSLNYLISNWYSGEPFDSRLEYLVSNWLSGKSANNDIAMFKQNDIPCLGEITLRYLDGDDLLSLTQITNSAPIELTNPQVRMVLDIVDYYNFTYWNKDRALADFMKIHNLSPISFLM